MVKRVSKVRKSAILEHLLDLERQIRTELARASKERKAAGQRDRRSPGSRTREESLADEGDGPIVAEVAQRYLH
jgi:hypothetical protein